MSYTTQLVELRGIAPAPWRVFAKLELQGPTGSIKDRIAGPMVDAAERAGTLRPGMTIVEASSGNTTIALGPVARERGYRVLAITPESMSPEKVRLHERWGVEMRSLPAGDPNARDNPRRVLARDIASSDPERYVTLDQFDAPANREAHARVTAPQAATQLRDQFGPETQIDWYVGGVGTGGSLAGMSQGLRATGVAPALKVALVDPVGSAIASLITRGEFHPVHLPAPDGIGERFIPSNLRGLSIDAAHAIERAEALQALALLAEQTGIQAGPVTGYALAGASRIWSNPAHEPGNIMIMVCDGADRYWSDAAYRAVFAVREALDPQLNQSSAASRSGTYVSVT